jgi:ferredoxin
MAMTLYKVRLINLDQDLDQTIEVPEGEYILDIAEAAGIRLPSGCKQGNCSACIVKVMTGKVDQSEQTFLQGSEIDAGFAVTCVAYPLSDCVLATHQEQCLYNDSLYFETQSLSSEL